MQVFVYYNLHSEKWSVKALDGEFKGLVVAHCDSIELDNCRFKVSQKGRERVLKEKQKNIHAGITGDVIRASGIDFKKPVNILQDIIVIDLFSEEVTYNPYKYQQFVLKENDSLYVQRAKTVVMTDKKVFAVF